MKIKDNGIVRKVDDLGRIVIPKEIRTQLGIQDWTPCEIINCVDESGRAFAAVRPFDAFLHDVNEAKVRNILNILAGDSVRFCVWSKTGATFGDTFSKEGDADIKNRIHELFVRLTVADSAAPGVTKEMVREDTAIEAFTIMCNDERGSLAAVLFACGSPEAIESKELAALVAVMALRPN